MKILFIQTGGTIDKDYPKLIKGYAFEIAEPATIRILDKVNPSFEYNIISILKKDSLDITEKDRKHIYETCAGANEDKIIITHGTDTMIDTAKKLKSIKGKTIIITGSMRPERFSNSDASFNLGVAVGALQHLKEGIYISMNGKIYSPENVKRDTITGQFI